MRDATPFGRAGARKRSRFAVFVRYIIIVLGIRLDFGKEILWAVK